MKKTSSLILLGIASVLAFSSPTFGGGGHPVHGVGGFRGGSYGGQMRGGYSGTYCQPRQLYSTPCYRQAVRYYSPCRSSFGFSVNLGGYGYCPPAPNYFYTPSYGIQTPAVVTQSVPYAQTSSSSSSSSSVSTVVSGSHNTYHNESYHNKRISYNRSFNRTSEVGDEEAEDESPVRRTCRRPIAEKPAVNAEELAERDVKIQALAEQVQRLADKQDAAKAAKSCHFPPSTPEEQQRFDESLEKARKEAETKAAVKAAESKTQPGQAVTESTTVTKTVLTPPTTTMPAVVCPPTTPAPAVVITPAPVAQVPVQTLYPLISASQGNWNAFWMGMLGAALVVLPVIGGLLVNKFQTPKTVVIPPAPTVVAPVATAPVATPPVVPVVVAPVLVPVATPAVVPPPTPPPTP